MLTPVLLTNETTQTGDTVPWARKYGYNLRHKYNMTLRGDRANFKNNRRQHTL